MSKKIVILSASCRKMGNSNSLCGEFARGAQEAGHEVKTFRLPELTINGCLGCCACQANGGSCVQKDDMTQLYAALREADAWVLATPVYFYSVASRLKAAMDRCFALFGGKYEKKAYFIYSATDTNSASMTSMVTSFRQFVACFSGIEEGGVLEGVGAADIGDVQKLPVFQEAYEMGKSV